MHLFLDQHKADDDEVYRFADQDKNQHDDGTCYPAVLFDTRQLDATDTFVELCNDEQDGAVLGLKSETEEGGRTVENGERRLEPFFEGKD